MQSLALVLTITPMWQRIKFRLVFMLDLITSIDTGTDWSCKKAGGGRKEKKGVENWRSRIFLWWKKQDRMSDKLDGQLQLTLVAGRNTVCRTFYSPTVTSWRHISHLVGKFLSLLCSLSMVKAFSKSSILSLNNFQVLFGLKHWAIQHSYLS